MFKLYTAANLPDAYIVFNLLQQAGIEARVFNEHAQGGLGEIPFIQAYPEVWVMQPGDAEKARSVLAAYQAQIPSTETRMCPKCRESNPVSFDVCGSCAAAIV